MSEQWQSPRAKAEQERRQRHEAFEALGAQVDAGELTWEQVFAIQNELGPVALIAIEPATYYQERAIRRLERSIDGAEAGND